jgi:hypothetical protein
MVASIICGMGGGNLSIKEGLACLFAILFLFLSNAGFSQTAATPSVGSVEGVVLDEQNKPIPEANVYAPLPQDMRRRVATTTTDSSGKFGFRDLPTGVVYIYAYKVSDGYPDGFFRFFKLPNDQPLVSAKVEAGQVTTGVTIKRGARAAHLKVNVTDENGNPLGGYFVFTREDQPGAYQQGASPEESMLVPPVPFRLTVGAMGYGEWHYGGANYAGKAGLIALKSGQTLNLAVRLRKN